ncbi:hypothetical protein NQD34_013568 [Periophthalmus magnuspinnatus]|nr:hypothetical protein NQD34_013568 [Periophthalmus magnuspinnatus]
MCDPNVLGLNKERQSSECSVDNSNMGFSNEQREQHNVKDESIEHVKQEPQPEIKQSFASTKTDHLSHVYANQETFEIVQTEMRKEECSIKLHLKQNVNNQGSETRENDCKGFGRCEGLQSCSDLDVNTKTAKGNNEVMTEKIEASENTGLLSQMKPNQEKCDRSDNLGADTIVNANNGKGGGGEDRSEINPGLPLCFSNQNEQTIEIMATEKQEQGIDQSEKRVFAMNMEGTIGRTNEDDCDKRQGISAGGSPAEINLNNAIDKVIHNTDYSTDDTSCIEVNTLSMTLQPDRTAYVKLDEREMNKSCLLRESGKNGYEKVEKDCTGDGLSDRNHAGEFSKDSEIVLGLSSEPLSKSQSMERLMSVEGNKDKAGSYCKNNVGGDVVQSNNKDIKAAHKKSDPGCSASVNQNFLRQSFLTMQEDEAGVQGEKNYQKMNVEQLEITEKSDLSLEDSQRTESQIDATVKPMKRMTIYEYHLENMQGLKDGKFNKSQTDMCERGKTNISPPQSLPGTETENHHNLGDVSCKTHNLINNDKAESYCKDNVGGDVVQSNNMDIKAAHIRRSSLTLQKDKAEVQGEKNGLKMNVEQLEITKKSHLRKKIPYSETESHYSLGVRFRRELFESCVVIKEGNQDTIKLTLKPRENNDKTTKCYDVSMTEME